ncbi:MAG: hypothetical protein SFU53_07050 [Terrimicrobiaceae bacterium]|nr:hypothetical protein [Terrimicrobiaceae bacterium]
MGALWPSSPALARKMVEAARVQDADRVVEIGPGSGAFTGQILAALKPGAQLLAVEKSGPLARGVASRFPGAKVREDCATRLADVLREESFEPPQAILSGLPWAAFPQSLQQTILTEIHRVLDTGGTFTTFAYFGPHRLPAGRRFRDLLNAFFSDVQRTSLVLANVPPAFVYVCRR